MQRLMLVLLHLIHNVECPTNLRCEPPKQHSARRSPKRSAASTSEVHTELSSELPGAWDYKAGSVQWARFPPESSSVWKWLVLTKETCSIFYFWLWCSRLCSHTHSKFGSHQSGSFPRSPAAYPKPFSSTSAPWMSMIYAQTAPGDEEFQRNAKMRC